MLVSIYAAVIESRVKSVVENKNQNINEQTFP